MENIFIYWQCECGNINRYTTNQTLVLAMETNTNHVGYDECAKCNKNYGFELELRKYEVDKDNM